MTLNALQQWEKDHRAKILLELRRAGIALTLENIPRIIEETSFRVRSKKDLRECDYYQKNPPRQCHPEVEDLNCFLCACPNYVSEKIDGGCRAGSKRGKVHYHKNLPAGEVWACCDCPVNHSPGEVRRYLEENMGELQREDAQLK